MARPLRIEFVAGIYHVTSRRNAREDIYADDDERIIFLQLLQITLQQSLGSNS